MKFLIEIPEDSAADIAAALRRRSAHASRLVAEKIERAIAERQATNHALATMDKAEIEALVDTISPGFNRFRLLSALGSIEENERTNA